MLLNSILTYIAGLLVVLLFAALVGPSLVDWNQFRAEIEAQASEAVGRPVSIGGDIRFQMLPAPQMTLNKIKIGHLANSGSLPSNHNFATFEAIDAEVALAPLLGGDIKITSIVVLRPQINLEILPDGTPNWGALDMAERIPANGMFSLASISLDKASFEGGTINYSNRVNGRAWKAENVSGEIVASSLLGPMRMDAEAVLGGVPVAMRIGLGAFDGQKAFQVTAEIEAQNYPARFLFSGVATEPAITARLDGNGRLRIGDASKDGASLEVLRVDAGLVLNMRGLDLRNLTVASAGSTLTGDAQIRWERRPVFSLDLSSESFSLDPLLDLVARDKEKREAPLADMIMATQPPAWLDGNVEIEAKTLLVRNVPLREVMLDLSLEKGALEIRRASAELGGSTQIELGGKLSPDEEGSRFDGRGEMKSANVAALASWLAPVSGEAARATAARSPFSIRSRLRFEHGLYVFDEIAAANARDLASPALRGKLRVDTSGKRPAIGADFDIARFDFEPLTALLPEGGDALAWLDAHDIALRLHAEDLTLFRQRMKGVETELSLRSGTLGISRLDVKNISGAALSLSGELAGVTTGARDDVKGRFSGTIKADRFGGLLEIGGFDVPDIEGPVDLIITGASGEAEDSQLRVDTLTLRGTVRGSRVDGVAKRRHGARGGVDRLEFSGTAANEEGRVLLEQLGLAPQADLSGTGTVSVQLDGDTGGIYDTNFRANVGGTTLTARGKVEKPFEALRFTGRVDIAASGVMHVLGGFGAPKPLADWVGAQAAGPGFVLSSDVIWDKASLALSDFEGVAGSFRLSGNANWVAGEGETLPRFTGSIEANGIDLTPLIVEKDSETIWPADALDWSALAKLDAEVDLKVGSVVLGRLAAGDVTTRLSVSHGVLTASPFVGSYGRGRLSIGARIEGGEGQPGVGLTILLENADLRSAITPVAGAAPATGRLDLNAQVQAEGRSWLGLVSSLAGNATAKLSGARIEPLDLPGFSAALSRLIEIEAFPALVEEKLFQGATAFEDTELSFAIADGLIRSSEASLALTGGKGALDLFYDLPRLASDTALAVELAAPEGVPGFTISAVGRGQKLDIVTDTLDLQNFMARRLLQKSLEEAGAGVPKELRELLEVPAGQGGGAMPLPRPAAGH
jgi:uncharacterized protein involved in outer membrane biogenesis